ncbi:hypothetical protein KCU81_g9756, partial [Aureobasidium melanogenum]
MQAAYCYRTWLKARSRASPFILSKRKGQASIVAPTSFLNVWTQEIKKAFHAATLCEYKSLSITAKDKAAAKFERREARAPPRKLKTIMTHGLLMCFTREQLYELPRPTRTRKATQPVAMRRGTRKSLKASKPVIKDASADSEDEIPAKRPITMKRGKIVYPTEEEIRNVSSILVSADAAAAVPENTTANTLKRAATEPGSDFDELASDHERIKVDIEVTHAVKPSVPTVLSVDPVVKTYIVNDSDTVDVSTDIHMAVDKASDAGASDVPSNVASAATSGDHDDF